MKKGIKNFILFTIAMFMIVFCESKSFAVIDNTNRVVTEELESKNNLSSSAIEGYELTWTDINRYYIGTKEYNTSAGYLRINNKKVFCLEHGVDIVTGSGYSKLDPTKILTQKKIRELSFWTRYGFACDKTAKNYTFTQLRLWELMHPDRNFIIGTSKYSDNKKSEYNKWKKEVGSRISAAMTKPSIDKKTYKMAKGQTLEVVDTQVLDAFRGSRLITNNDKVKIEVSDNKLKITLLEDLKDSIKLSFTKDTVEYTGSSKNIVYRKAQSQTVGLLGSVDPTQYSLNIEPSFSGKVTLIKKDIDSGKALSNAVFNLLDSKENPIGIKKIEEGKYQYNAYAKTYDIKTDSSGNFSIIDLPEGKYYLKEVKAPMGYKQISESKVEFSLTKNKPETKLEMFNKLKTRVKLSKLDGKSNKSLVGAEFKLYSQDGNLINLLKSKEGNYRFDKNSKLSIAKTDSRGNLEVSDLPTGKYYFKEVKAPKGYEIDSKEKSFELTGDNPDVEIKFLNYKKHISISTRAIFKDEKKVEHAIDGLNIEDIVSYKGLIKGEDYTLKASLVVKNGDKIKVISKASRTFKAENSNGEIRVQFNDVDLSKLKSKNITVFEKLYYDGRLVAEHEDINDKNQSLDIRQVKIRTKASSDNTKLVKLIKDATITDTISYNGLIVGEKYKVKGLIMDKDSQSALLDHKGRPIYSEYEFVADKSSGQIKLKFNLDSRMLAGKNIVVFEDLYYKGKIIAEHKDINDENQTVVVDKEPTKKREIKANNKPKIVKSKNNPETGDKSFVTLFAIVIFALISLILVNWYNQDNIKLSKRK